MFIIKMKNVYHDIEIENDSLRFASCITWPIIVDLPVPDGAEMIINFPVSMWYLVFVGCSWLLQHVQHLLLDLLQLVLHAHHHLLQFGLVGLRA